MHVRPPNTWLGYYKRVSVETFLEENIISKVVKTLDPKIDIPQI